MVKVRSLAWHDEVWEIRFEIQEGVYRLDDYPVRITHLGRLPESEVADDLALVATGLLQRHMRRGAVPPHAVVVNWTRVAQFSQGESEDLSQAIARIDQKRRESVESPVPEQV